MQDCLLKPSWDMSPFQMSLFWIQLGETIHPSIFCCFSWSGCWGNSSRRDISLPIDMLQILLGDLKSFQYKIRSRILPEIFRFPPSGVKTLQRKDIIRCLSHLSWLLLKLRRSGSAPNSTRKWKLLTLWAQSPYRGGHLYLILWLWSSPEDHRSTDQ